MNNTNAVVNQMSSVISMYHAQIQNLQGTTDASIPGGESGDSRFSKTPAGIRYQQERTNAKDNYLRQRCDEFVASLFRNLINVGLQAMNGNEAIEITKEQRDKLLAAGYEVPEDELSITVEFDKLKNGEFRYDVDANSSIVKNDDETKDRMVELLKTLLEVPNIDQIMADDEKEIHLSELIIGIISTSGIDKTDKIVTELSQEKRAQMEQAGLLNAPQEMSENNAQAVEQAIEPDVINHADEKVKSAEALRQRGWDEERIVEYINRIYADGGNA